MNLGDIENEQNAKEALRQLKANRKTFCEFAKLQAQIKRAFYEECLQKGFDERQALQLTSQYNPFSGR